MKNINVVIADDHPIVLLGLKELVEREENFCVIGEAVSSSELVKILKSKNIDLIITDFNMPDNSPYGDGLKLIEYLTRNFPTIKILVLTMISNQLILTRLKELGVLGVILKNQMHTEIESALKAISSDRPVRSTALHQNSVNTSSSRLDTRFRSLSPKEHEILRLFSSGISVNQIAKKMNRSSKTISTQKVSAMRKLGVHSDQELLAYCIEQNLFN